MSLNPTLWHHLPPDRQKPPKDEFEEQELIALALENIDRRVKFDHPDDILSRVWFEHAVGEVLLAVESTSFRGSDLDQYLRHGLLVPRYRVKPRCRLYPVTQILTFSPDGLLLKVEIDLFPPFRRKKAGVLYRHPEAAENFPPFQGLIQENPPPLSPDVREAKRSTPLFTFSQVGVVLALHRATKRTVDLLPLLSATPTQLAKIRKTWLAEFRGRLGRDVKPRFCANPACEAWIPLTHVVRKFPEGHFVLQTSKKGDLSWKFSSGGHLIEEKDFYSLIIQKVKRSSQNRYCSQECKDSAIRARQPKSTARVAAWYQKKAAKIS